MNSYFAVVQCIDEYKGSNFGCTTLVEGIFLLLLLLIGLCR